MKDAKKHKIAVIGAGESGTWAAVLAQKQGYDVFVSDASVVKPQYVDILESYGIMFESGGHSEHLILGCDLIIKSPGVPNNASMIMAAKQKGIKVISEIDFASRFTDAKIIGVTGSNGKSTTVTLIDHILRADAKKSRLCGNIGTAFSKVLVLEKPYDYYVLEVSSFQLDDLESFRCDVALLLNISPDHLDRYENKIEKYTEAKFKITHNQQKGDAFIYNFDDPVIRKYVESGSYAADLYPFSLTEKLSRGGYINDDQIIINCSENHKNQIYMNELALKGVHNKSNSMAASVVAKLLDVRNEVVRESLYNFKNLEHRLEYVVQVHGIEFINDSKATNINSAWYSLESMDKPVIWIAGGIDKGNDYNELKHLVKEKVRAIISLGKDNSKLEAAFEGDVEEILKTQSMREAVKLAYHLAKKGEVVLLAPACSSFDLFESYEDRGRQFKEAVRTL